MIRGLDGGFSDRGDPVRSKQRRIDRALPWLALGCAFSPVLAQLGRTISGLPFGWSVALAPILMLWVGFTEQRAAEPRRGIALGLILLGVLMEVVGLLGGTWVLARLGLSIAMVGVSLWTGVPAPMAAALAFWAVPIPDTVFSLTTPGVESGLAQAGAAVGSLLGGDIHASGPLMRSGADHLELDPYHGGIHLAWLAAELAWLSAVRRDAPLLTAVLQAAVAALLALPLWVAAVIVAALLLVGGAPGLGSAWLDHGVWLLAAVVGLAWIESRARRA